MLLAFVVGWLLGGASERTRLEQAAGTLSELEVALASCDQGYAQAERARQSLLEETAYLSQSVSVEKEACAALSLTLSESEREMSELREQVAFYKAIVSPASSETGLHIHDLSFRAVGDGVYAYTATLVQSTGAQGKRSGTLDMRFVGVSEGVTRVLRLSELLISDEPRLGFSFRYYADMYGEIQLPGGFEPLRVVVSLKPSSGALDRVSRTFAWSDVVGG